MELDNLDSECNYVHHDDTTELGNQNPHFSELSGHPICCELPLCSSPLRGIRAAATHYPILQIFSWLLYSARKSHRAIVSIDEALHGSRIDDLLKLHGIDDLCNLFNDDGSEHTTTVFSEDHALSGLGCIERHLLISHADIIAELQNKFTDDAEFACCSCEHLCQRKQVSLVNFSLGKYNTDAWVRHRAHIVGNNSTEKLYICQHCRPFLNKNAIPSQCVLNGLITESVPVELKSLDVLSKQLIQKHFRLLCGWVHILVKCQLIMLYRLARVAFFSFHCPLTTHLITLSEVQPDGVVALPDPQLFIIVNGVPTKNKIVWQMLVDVNAIKQAIQKLKEMNWLYKNVDDASLDDVSKKVVEVVEKPSSTMLEKASDVDLAAFQSHTIRSLDQHTSPVQDIDHYKMLNVKEKPIESRQSHLDVMCFPTLFPSGRYGKFHPREQHISASEYAKSRVLNKDGHFRKDAQYVFFLYWHQDFRWNI